MNSDVITAFTSTYVANGAIGPAAAPWLTPSGIATARYVKINAQIDF